MLSRKMSSALKPSMCKNQCWWIWMDMFPMPVKWKSPPKCSMKMNLHVQNHLDKKKILHGLRCGSPTNPTQNHQGFSGLFHFFSAFRECFWPPNQLLASRPLTRTTLHSPNPPCADRHPNRHLKKLRENSAISRLGPLIQECNSKVPTQKKRKLQQIREKHMCKPQHIFLKRALWLSVFDKSTKLFLLKKSCQWPGLVAVSWPV